MKHREMLFRLAMLALIIALSYATPTPLFAEPQEYCPWVEVDPGEKACTCEETGTPGINEGTVWECTLDGWEVDRGPFYFSYDCETFAETYCEV